MTSPALPALKMKDIDGRERSLEEFKGKALLLVNVASYCGNTPQYGALEEIYQKYKAEGFEILAFPANNFGSQEPGSEAEIREFCTTKYKASFPMFSKVEAKGENIHPLYKFLTTETDFKGDVTWNFAKFLADRQGRVVARFAPKLDPKSPQVLAAIEKTLAEK